MTLYWFAGSLPDDIIFFIFRICNSKGNYCVLPAQYWSVVHQLLGQNTKETI
jgi:hypothetical protein